MRKHSLRQKANIYLTSRQGSPRARKYRSYVILKMINDLFITGKVPPHSPVQVSFINEFNLLTQNQHTLIEVYGYRALCFIWHKALKKLRIPTKKSCRYLYVQLTYQQLIATQGKDEVTKLLMDELGLKSHTTLWGYLQEVVGQMGQVGQPH